MFLLWAAITDFHAFCIERCRARVGKKFPILGLNIFSIEHQCFSRRIWGVIWSAEAVPRRVMRAPSTYAWPWLMREKMPSRSRRKKDRENRKSPPAEVWYVSAEIPCQCHGVVIDVLTDALHTALDAPRWRPHQLAPAARPRIQTWKRENS